MNACKWTIKRFFLTLCVAALVAVAPLKAAEPLAVVSLKPTDELQADIEYLLEATGTSQLGQFVLPQVTAFLQGIDGKRPIGLIVSVEESEFIPLGFVPVTDLKGFLSQLQEQVGEPIDAGDGIMEFQGPQSVFVKEQGGWAFVAESVESLESLPAQPAQLLGGLHNEYDIGIRAYVRNIPEQFKQMAIGQISAGLDQGLAGQDDPNARRLAEAQVAQLRQMIQETDVVTLGWRIDEDGKQTYLDFSLTAVEGTKLSGQMESAAAATTSFPGFMVPDAAISGNFAGVIPADQIDQSVAALDSVEKSALTEIENDDDLPSDEARNAAKQLVSTFFGVARSTIKSGKIDSVTSIILKPKAMTLVSAAHVASGEEVESAVKQLVELAETEPDISFSKVQFNAEQHAGVDFHVLSLPIPDEEYVSQVLGDQLDIVIGTGETSAYVALGTDGLTHLKRMVDASSNSQSAKVDPFNVTIALTPILEFADSIESNPIVSGLAQSLAVSGGKDHVRVRTTAIENGVTYRFLIEEGVLRLVGQGVQMGAAGGF